MEDLIEEYKELAIICFKTDYSDFNSVKNNNKSVDRMIEIVEEIRFIDKAVKHFIKLLNIEDQQINLWAAIHILEKLSVDSRVKEKALNIIKIAAQNKNLGVKAMGFRMWLEDWHKRNM